MLLSLLGITAVFQLWVQLEYAEDALKGSAAASVSEDHDVAPAVLAPAIAIAGWRNSDSCAFKVKISCSRSCNYIQMSA